RTRLAVDQHDQFSSESIAAACLCYHRLRLFTALYVSELYVVIENVSDQTQQCLFVSSAITAQIDNQRLALSRPPNYVIHFLRRQIKGGHLPDRQFILQLVITMPVKPFLVFLLPNQIIQIVAREIHNALALRDLRHHIKLLLLAVRFNDFQTHAAAWTQSLILILDLPKILSHRPKAIDGVDFITLFQTFSFRIAAGLHRDDVTLLADHLHLPTVLERERPDRRHEVGVGVVKVNDRLGDDAEHLILSSCCLNLLFRLFEACLDVHTMKVGIVIVLFEI